MRDGTFEAYGSRDYEYIVPYDEDEKSAEPTSAIEARKSLEYEKDISQLKQDVHQLKTALKAIMDLLGKQSNHPLY